MLGRSRSGNAIPSTQVFLLSSIAANTVSRASAAASVLLMIATPLKCLMKTAIVGGPRSAALIGSFCRESSANEPDGTARPGRARGSGAAGIAAMSAAVGLPRFGLPPASPGQRGRLHDHGADRSAVPGAAVLWLAADGGVAGDPGPCRQPQTGAAPDAARRPGGDLSAAEYEQAGTGAQDLPLPAWGALDRTGQSGVVRGRHLHPDGPGLSLPGGDHGLGEPCRAGVAAVEHARRGVLCRGP